MKVKITWFRFADNFDAYIVIDVLRFTSTVTTAFRLGFRRIYVLADVNKALKFAKLRTLPLLAEIEGLKAADADLDNSPSELEIYGPKFLGLGKNELVMRSTSGANLLMMAAKNNLKNVFMASLLNANAVANYIILRGFKSVNIACAGFKLKEFAIEDFIGAGAIINELMGLTSEEIEVEDEELSALLLYRFLSLRDRIPEVLMRSRSGKVVQYTGHLNDIIIASQVNTVDIIPYLADVQDFDHDMVGIVESVRSQ